MQPTPEQILKEQAQSARALRWRSLVEQQETEATKSQFSAQLISFNAEIGMWLCQLPNGSQIFARSISPGGTKGKGDIVSLTRPSTGMAVIRSLS